MRNKIKIITGKLDERFGKFGEKDLIENHQIKITIQNIKEKARVSTKAAGVPNAASYL
jgi:hypothetical protein